MSDSKRKDIKEMTVEALQDYNEQLTQERADIRNLQAEINLRIDVLTIAGDIAKKHQIKPDLDAIEKQLVEQRMAKHVESDKYQEEKRKNNKDK